MISRPQSRSLPTRRCGSPLRLTSPPRWTTALVQGVRLGLPSLERRVLRRRARRRRRFQDPRGSFRTAAHRGRRPDADRGDRRGRQPADAGFSLNVDNVPPVITSAAIDTAFDGVGGGQSWFPGPDGRAHGRRGRRYRGDRGHQPGRGPDAPAAVVSSTRYPGTFDSGSGRWTFPNPARLRRRDRQFRRAGFGRDPPRDAAVADAAVSTSSSRLRSRPTRTGMRAAGQSVPRSLTLSAAPRSLWATIIPSVAVPLALVGTCALMYVFGYSSTICR